MSEVNFYLKKPDASGKSLIYLQYKYNGRRCVFAFGQTVWNKSDKQTDWNKSKQRVKKNTQTTEDGKRSLNDLLDNLSRVCEKTYNEQLKNGIPEPEVLKATMQAFINQNDKGEVNKPTLYGLIERFIANEISYKGRSKSNNTLKTYITTKGHLQEFEKSHKYKIDFEAITLDFYYKYVSFLQKKKNPLSVNAIGKDIQILKVFMGEAVDLGYTNNLQYMHKKFAVTRVDTDAVYLTDDEILKLYQHDFSDSKKLEQVRDLFVFGCYVGLRFSDYSDVKPENIVTIDGERFIKLITKKTNDLVIIPCNPVVLQIFQKYKANHNNLPKSISNQKFNEYIKDVLEEAKFNEVGRLATDQTKELWECISSHTARRSFATNYYLQGFPTIDLMKITGHRTEKSFMQYIRATKLQTAKRLQVHIKKNWSNYLFKAAS